MKYNSHHGVHFAFIHLMRIWYSPDAVKIMCLQYSRTQDRGLRIYAVSTHVR